MLGCRGGQQEVKYLKVREVSAVGGQMTGGLGGQ